jgi:hypothetical protein
MRILAVSLITAAAALVSNVPASAQTVDEILQKHYAARGGLEKIKAIQPLYSERSTPRVVGIRSRARWCRVRTSW